jgi:hypothetical protein
MTYRKEELDQAIEEYLGGLCVSELVLHVRGDMQKTYGKATNDDVDEFISQMNGDW